MTVLSLSRCGLSVDYADSDDFLFYEKFIDSYEPMIPHMQLMKIMRNTFDDVLITSLTQFSSLISIVTLSAAIKAPANECNPILIGLERWRKEKNIL